MAIILGPTLETERLILRPPIAEDLDGWAALAGDAETTRYLGGPQPRPVAWRALAGMAGSWALQEFGMFSVIERASGAWIGRVGPWRPEGWPGTEVGWSLLRSAWGNGFAHEATVATMDWAIDTLGWTDIIHTIDPENAASIALARRIGSTDRGPGRGPGRLPAPYQDRTVVIFGQSADAWRARRRA